MQFKLLITSGCSFSHHRDAFTWPCRLSEIIDLPLLSHSIGSQGNALIARNIDYSVYQALQQYSPEQLLVGVMWSGSDRWECRPEPHLYRHAAQLDMVENPTGWIGKHKPWVIMNHHFTDRISQMFYQYMYTHKWGLINTMEQILRIQNLLTVNNIRYFMTQYSDNVLPRGEDVLDPELNYLYQQIDFDHWLPVNSQYEWCRDHSGLPFPVPTDHHPGLHQHTAFVQQIVLPYLRERNWIDPA